MAFPPSHYSLFDSVRNDSYIDVDRALTNDPLCHCLRDNRGQTALHVAAHKSDNEIEYPKTYAARIIHRLVAAGADINARDDLGQTPLHIAVTESFPSAIETLVNLGADVNARDKNDMSPIDAALAHADIRPLTAGYLAACIKEAAAKMETTRREREEKHSARHKAHLAVLDKLAQGLRRRGSSL